MGWFLYDDGLGHERVNLSKPMITSTATRIIIIIIITKTMTTTALTTIIVKMRTRATTTSKIAISEILKKQ